MTRRRDGAAPPAGHPPAGRPAADPATDGGPIPVATRWLLRIRSLGRAEVASVAVASAGGATIGSLATWPAWGLVIAALAPWGVVLVAELAWVRRHHGMLALFHLLVVTQAGHLLEHVVQVVQVHVMHLEGAAAGGVFSALDVEWVHFWWNTWVLAATVPLLLRYRDNPWLRLAAAAALWHEVEHAYLILGHVRTGLEGDPGLLARGGALGGGVPVPRVDLHFLYNVVETLPLFIAFGVAIRAMRTDAGSAAPR